jgi:hypothetical protein
MNLGTGRFQSAPPPRSVDQDTDLIHQHYLSFLESGNNVEVDFRERTTKKAVSKAWLFLLR